MANGLGGRVKELNMKINKVLQQVCEDWGITMDELKGKKRFNWYVKARKIAAYQLSARGFSSTSIGKILKKDHSTILHYLK